MVKVLLQAGANAWLVNEDLRLPKDVARDAGHIAVHDFLVEWSWSGEGRTDGSGRGAQASHLEAYTVTHNRRTGGVGGGAASMGRGAARRGQGHTTLTEPSMCKYGKDERDPRISGVKGNKVGGN